MNDSSMRTDCDVSHAFHDQQQNMSQDEGRKEVRRRRRQILSCLPCRRLKVKCDRKLPCSHCVWSERATSCVYSLSSFPRKRSESRSTRASVCAESQVQSVSSDSGRSEKATIGASTCHSAYTPKPILLPKMCAQDIGPALASSMHMNTSGSPSTLHKDQLRGYFFNYTAWKSKFRGPTHWISCIREACFLQEFPPFALRGIRADTP